MPNLLLVATDETDRTVTVVLDGVRYEYWFRDNFRQVLTELRVLLRRGAEGGAVNMLKARSWRCDKL